MKSDEEWGRSNSGWTFVDEIGSFEWKNPPAPNQLYFPICNEAGMMCSFTPSLHGDATTGQHSFLRLPLVMTDLHNTRSARNFWIYNEELGPYSLTGNSARQRGRLYSAEDSVETIVRGGFLCHTLIRTDRAAGIRTEIISFCPDSEDTVEINVFRIENLSDGSLAFSPTSAFPLYCRSAENLRDHNHWTSLCHRMRLYDEGLAIEPAIHHDEGGHRPDDRAYFVFAVGGDGERPIGQFPTIAEFIGDEGSLDWPEAVVRNIDPARVPPNRRDGMEAVGAMRFGVKKLAPGGIAEYVVIEGVSARGGDLLRNVEAYGSSSKAKAAWEGSRDHWSRRARAIEFRTGDEHFGKWMRWVGLQPALRKIYGNSFLPHFDYGKGGRGWRDLWQDSLALLLQNPGQTRPALVSFFAGVRLDGSNATIIGKKIGEFLADRNRVSRVWMDHGIWPFYTLKLYIDQSGDLEVLFEKVQYWKDHQIRRAKARDGEWKPSDGTAQRKADGGIYSGSVLEHILVQHLTCFHNVGDHNNIRLEDADWNDLLDMAKEKGESVPFGAFYGWNLIEIAAVLRKYRELKGVDSVVLMKELLLLTGLEGSVDYESPERKRERLELYFLSIEKGISGSTSLAPIEALCGELERMGRWILLHVREKEWIESRSGSGFFNGYYNNDGERVDGDHEDGIRMNLTAQTFAVMTGAASDDQSRRSFESAWKVLRDPYTGGLRLTTPLGPNSWNFGRGFAVVYGEKETGGTFNHMAVMFMNGLYRRGLAKEGHEVFKSIYEAVNRTERSGIYPGIPEYISHEGRGKYHYLSGSASWLLMTVLIEMFGVKGQFGDLVLEPKLAKSQFDERGIAQCAAFFLGRRIRVSYYNGQERDIGEYGIARVVLNGVELRRFEEPVPMAELSRALLEHLLSDEEENRFEIYLE